MSQQENTASCTEIPLETDKSNITTNQNKSNTPDKPKNNLTLANLTNFQPIQLDNKLSTEKNDKILIINNIKYGIDESGNPINIKDYYKSINDSVNLNLNSNTSIFSGFSSMTTKLKKPIAYITKDENNNNILIDLKGNKITTKNKDGDYDFPLQLHVIIKDFDVKHPELRVNGERYYKDNIINEDIEIVKEIEEEKQKEKDLSPITKTPESPSKFFGGIESPEFHNLGAKINGSNLLHGDNKSNNKDNNKDNTYFTKYHNINLFEGNNNQVVLRTSGILNNSNYQSPNNYKKNKKIINKQLTKNRSFLAPILRNNTTNFLSFKNKRDLSDNHKVDNSINNKIKITKKTLNINNIKGNINRKKYENNNDRKIANRNKCYNKYNEKLNTEIDKNNEYLSYFCPNNNKRKENQKQLNNNNNLSNYRYVATRQLDKNNTNNNMGSQNYFIIKHNKSFTNSKLLKKKDNNEGKENLLKKINKKSIFIPINNKKEINNNNIFIDLQQNSKNKNIKNISNNSNINKIKIKKNIKINNQDLSQRMRKIEIPKKEKILKINSNNNTKYYVLSEEANNMIQSYSKNKNKRENQLKNIESPPPQLSNKKKSPNFKLKKNIILTNDNFNNSYFSSTVNKKIFKNEKKENIMKQSLDKINKKYVGITLSLSNNENNKDKNIKITPNNQININFTPCQIQCESIIKNNNTNNQQNINNILEKNDLNESKNKYCENKYISPNYEIYL